MTKNDESFIQINHLLDNLQIEQLDTCLFRGQTKAQRLVRVFGGQVLAQAVNAASRTLDSQRSLHSLHAYFLRPGNPEKAIIYEVDPIRDGGSFTTRRVVAKQDGKAIFNASLSFQIAEEGLEHQMDLPADVPSPETLVNEHEFWLHTYADRPEKTPMDIGQFKALDIRMVNRRNSTSPKKEEPVQGMWLKVNTTLSDDMAVHQTLLAYVSDMKFLGTALRPHPFNFHSAKGQVASLDHAMWFHCDFRVDDWLYYHMDSPRAAGSRGFVRGSFYTQSGILVASTAQEALMRIRTK
jgi:acyl-CoA thioesterase II